MKHLYIVLIAFTSLLVFGSCKTNKAIQTADKSAADKAMPDVSVKDVAIKPMPEMNHSDKGMQQMDVSGEPMPDMDASDKTKSAADATALKTVDFLPGLRKANQEELKDESLFFDGESIPIYLPDGKRVRGMEMIDIFMAGTHVPEPYIDDNADVKAFVFRIATEEEMKQIKALAEQSLGENELSGNEALPFSTTDILGNTYSLEGLKDKVVVANFWFIACQPCRTEIPELNELVEKYAEKDVVFLGFAIDTKEELQAFLKEMPFHYNIIPDSRQVIFDYGVSAFPTHLVIKNQTIELALSGLGPTTIQQLDGKIGELLE